MPTWQPIVGREVQTLLERALADAPSRDRVLAEALDIMSKCPPPSAKTATAATGLALGYVQSGKTLSFTALAALARDNGYPIVIVLCGTTTSLFKQSVSRLSTDLGFSTRNDRAWLLLENPTSGSRETLDGALAPWRDPKSPDFAKATVLMTVMKHASRIRSVAALLRGTNLQQTPTLIIDDEADQAGLNTLVRRDEVSATYSAILGLRAAAPNHAYVEYTATPQALLLISIIDSLSPNFAKVLTPGADYVGGADYFLRNPPLVEIIPGNELPTAANNLRQPPGSFLKALRLFFVGVAIGCILDSARGNRSMMVHPSRLRDTHGDYVQWAKHVKREWLQIIGSGAQDPDYVAFQNEMIIAYQDLERTVGNMPSFDDVFAMLRYAIQSTEIVELNARGGATPQINWRNQYSHILVGGQAIDRGFTVEGLTITYMPRDIGQGNADTLAQRARFFGYKRNILGFCRVFLESTVARAYRQYVTHEEDVRAKLSGLGSESLREWRRRFFLDPLFEPTRANVFRDPLVRGVATAEWYSPKRPYIDPHAVEANSTVVRRFVDQLGAPGNFHGHDAYFDVALDEVFSSLLVPLQYTDPGDAESLASYLLQIRVALERAKDEQADVFVMREGRESVRSVDDRGIKQLFAGARPKRPPHTYPGDRQIRREDRTAIQIHNLRVTRNTEDGETLASDVPVIAIALPQRMLQGVIEQPGNP